MAITAAGIDADTVIREAQGCSGILTRNAHIDGKIMEVVADGKLLIVHPASLPN